jgi:hypothetical protein
MGVAVRPNQSFKPKPSARLNLGVWLTGMNLANNKIENGEFHVLRLWRRVLVASIVTALLLLCDLLFRTEIPLFSPFSTYVMPDWLGALLLVLIWLVPVAWILRWSGLRRATLAQFVFTSFFFVVFTVASVVAIALVVLLTAAVYLRLVD